MLYKQSLDSCISWLLPIVKSWNLIMIQTIFFSCVSDSHSDLITFCLSRAHTNRIPTGPLIFYIGETAHLYSGCDVLESASK